jgi:hypothetical protein
MDYKELKERQRAIRDEFSESLGLRVHRALSWLYRSEQEADDEDACFIFLWVAFNSAYANDLHNRKQFTEQGLFSHFIDVLIELDTDKLLENIVWKQFPGPIRLLIDNKYIYQPFWEYHNGRIDESNWEEQFKKSKAAANRALGNSDTAKVLMIVFSRLYTLRNQLIHGGATWNSGVNREQVRDGTEIMNKIVPTIIHIMMENHHQVWGEPCYPVVS